MADRPLAAAPAAEREPRRASMQRHGARTAAASAAAGSGAAASRTDTWPERWDAGPRDPGRYAVSRTRPEPRPTGLQTILDQEALLDMVLQQFTLEQARHLLAPVSRQLAARVRDESVQWKALTDFEFEFARGADMQTVHELFEHAYPFYRRDALEPYAAWLLERLCNACANVMTMDYHHLENQQWHVIFDCIPLEGQAVGTPGGVYRHSPEAESIRYKRWLATPDRRWDVVDMKTLSTKIERKCLELISPHCWQSWKDPPRWSESVCSAFREWQAKLAFAIDLNKIHTWSVLARLDEKTFLHVKTIIDPEIGSFANWNQFCFALLHECHEHYYPSQLERMDGLSYSDVRRDFERDVGPDFEGPHCKFCVCKNK